MAAAPRPPEPAAASDLRRPAVESVVLSVWAPFAGIGRAVTRPFGYRPSRKNPHYCATCVELSPPGGTNMDVGSCSQTSGASPRCRKVLSRVSSPGCSGASTDARNRSCSPRDHRQAHRRRGHGHLPGARAPRGCWRRSVIARRTAPSSRSASGLTTAKPSWATSGTALSTTSPQLGTSSTPQLGSRPWQAAGRSSSQSGSRHTCRRRPVSPKTRPCEARGPRGRLPTPRSS